MEELESEISRLEGHITGCETSLQTFVSAEETARLAGELEEAKKRLHTHLAEWEEATQALQN